MKEQPGIRPASVRIDSALLTSLPEPVQRIYTSVSAGLTDLLLATFDAIDDSLFELANHARSNNDQNRYFETMREVRIKRKGIEKRFQEGLGNLFYAPPGIDKSAHHQGQLKPANAQTLSLVQNDELEEQVAFNAMVGKANASFQGPLLQLESRFTVVYTGLTAEHPVNPLAPEHICRLFINVCNELDIAIRERLIVFKHFDRYVVANFGQLLDESNYILVAAGVLPDFRFTGRSEQPQDQISHRSTAGESPPAALQEALLEQIQTLLAQRRHRSNSPTASEHGHSNVHLLRVETSQLNQMLSELPRPVLGSDLTQGQPQTLDLQQLVNGLLKQQSRSDNRAVLHESDEDLINLVAMLFDFILDDYSLSAPVQVLISRLQLPILKVALQDRAFFSKPNHPARRLVNALAWAGIGWSDGSEKDRDRLYHKIHDIVFRIINEFDGDMALFDSLSKDFDTFLQREDHKSRLVEQRTQESERGRIKSQQAQETVDTLLQKRLSNRDIPESIRDILVNGWSRVMFLAYLRDASEHRWAACVQAVDDLLWCLRPLPDGNDRKQWVRVVPSLLKTLRSGLEEVSYNASRLDDMMTALKRELTEAFRRQAHEAARDEAPVISAKDQADNEAHSRQTRLLTAVEAQQALEDTAMQEHLETVDTLFTGQWVEFSLVNGTRFRCKLSAIIQEADCYVFVNRMGLKVAEKNRRDLAHELRRNRMQVLEQGALVDRAMDAILGSLSRKAS